MLYYNSKMSKNSTIIGLGIFVVISGYCTDCIFVYQTK